MVAVFRSSKSQARGSREIAIEVEETKKKEQHGAWDGLGVLYEHMLAS
jgi:hypothetical protein